MTLGSPPREFNFGAGNPDPGVFPSQALGEAAQRVLSRLGTELAHYPDPHGLPALRAVAVERFARNHGMRPPIEHVVITYGDISFEPQAERAVYSLANAGEVMYIGSFSKILGPGIRLGFFIASESIIERLMPWKTDGGTSALSQMIAAEYFSANLWPHVEEGRAAVKH